MVSRFVFFRKITSPPFIPLTNICEPVQKGKDVPVV